MAKQRSGKGTKTRVKAAAKPKAKGAAKAKTTANRGKAKQAKPKVKAKPKLRASAQKTKPKTARKQRTFGSRDALATAWNEQGRAFYGEFSARLTQFYEGDASVDLDMADPRSEEMGEQVMRAVIDLHAQGKRPRDVFDPAYSPVFPWIKQNKRSIRFVTILEPDELLVYRGGPWQDDGVAFHLRGNEATPLPDIIGMHRSRDRAHLVIARKHGLEIRDARAGVAALDQPPIATLPWPSPDIFRTRGLAPGVEWAPPADRLQVEQLAISDDGMRVVVSCYRQGILLGSWHAGERPWTLLWPDVRSPYGTGDDQTVRRAGDMTHVAISRDGTRVAFGSQDAGHFLAEIDGSGEPQWYATVGHLSEYPHYACFSDDGRYVALNSCHFYNGATVSFAWDGNRGAQLGSYDEHPQAPCIDGSLRVYAACWLDRPVLDAVLDKEAVNDGAFLLAGSGIMRLCAATGGIGFAQGFGSSAGSVDFCPESRRLAVSAYSGFVHLFDPYEQELPGRIDGYRPRRELARWVLWEHLPAGPVRW